MEFQEGLHGSTDELVEAGADRGAAGSAERAGSDSSERGSEGAGSTRAAIANAIVGLLKTQYGRGPTAAKAWILDDYVFVAMEGGLTRAEETLLADGKEEEIRAYRLSFQETISHTAKRAVTELTGREVLTYHSQIVFHPTRAFEIFVLEPVSGTSR